MTAVIQGIIAGLAFGILDVLVMVPLPLPNKATAMVASFINRFAIGFLIATVNLPMPKWATGALIGLFLSLPDAIITKTYAPILGIGIVGGIIIGIILSKV
ncbi:hypothetical protein A2778_05090 [Candidatus Daviesbacteria bacterium RIFCSPHIGHO2_01_FULL_40_24]|uniref:Uncharacterized protein n=1 Tax=Candidatus Curtissbacteria bacterium GW2011_GWC2_38_9 TaxID=1618414 RepID=A0A0G0LDB4_9BACT|nr:MAG: hypothetical protein UT12_C0006G0001 [Candidatus Curtissbacteria bacterium GW2011_GWC2_38_9]KKR17510.1 MAG: hypothetical protein UT45_C0001G0185 [Candidatus Daviesbacteria bacterium GW2011_GWA2_39_33]OGE21536.1 MAG: hypothetical protein A2778_05090 [Candidatus Daviesbacteria bacterium RIFCSPHIGHO2_01_FULL_40_24]OGE43635.1 MAG: hypothetical protein A3A53_03325 [Candidatus Daviesbacteria bacterium RIFCSPLOWO2_01_FULL_39_23]